MQTSTPTNLKPKEPKSILLIGPPGGGKTSLMLQFPNLAVFDCDMNLDGPERFVRKELKLDISYAYDCVPRKADGQPRPVYDCYDYLLSELTPDKVAPYDWVAVDSLSQVNEYIIRKILNDQRKTEMEARHWQPFKSAAMALLVGRLRHIGKNVIVSCHEIAMTKPAGPNKVMEEVVTGYIPFFQGRVGEMLGAFFTDMWRITGRPIAGGKREYLLETTSTALCSLKNTMGMPSEIRNPTYKDLEKYLQG